MHIFMTGIRAVQLLEYVILYIQKLDAHLVFCDCSLEKMRIPFT